MEIIKNLDGDKLVIALKGRLDTTTAPELENELKNALTGIKSLVMDFKELEYISSAGLRVLLQVSKIMNGNGEYKITNVCSDIMEVFEITGFVDILTIE